MQKNLYNDVSYSIRSIRRGKNLKYLPGESTFSNFQESNLSSEQNKISQEAKVCIIMSKFLYEKYPNFVAFFLFLVNFLFWDTIFTFMLHYFVVNICSSFPGDQILLTCAFKNRSKFSRRGTCLEQI